MPRGTAKKPAEHSGFPMTTIRQLEPRDFKRAELFAEAGPAVAGSDSTPHFSPAPGPVGGQIRHLPRRPDAATLCKAIPFFYVGQNRHGFWVARESEGKIGGLFLRKQSALRFARKFSKPQGCATMFLDEPFELDVENQGGRLTALLAATTEIAARRLPAVATFIGLMVTEWRKLVVEISRAVAGERRNRAAIERELFRGHYRLSSKNDDDLPIP
jgi:hypothetical protein